MPPDHTPADPSLPVVDPDTGKIDPDAVLIEAQRRRNDVGLEYVGPCNDDMLGLNGAWLWCNLAQGHSGDHVSAEGTRWRKKLQATNTPPPTVDVQEAVARAIGEAHMTAPCMPLTDDDLIAAIEAGAFPENATFDDAQLVYDRHIAEAVLATLSSLGVLLPSSGERREEAGNVIVPGPDRKPDGAWWLDDHPDWPHTHVRTVTTFPDGSVLTSPWREV